VKNFKKANYGRGPNLYVEAFLELLKVNGNYWPKKVRDNIFDFFVEFFDEKSDASRFLSSPSFGTR